MAKTDDKSKQPEKNPDKNGEVIYAAGGILRRRDGLLKKIALVQRTKYNDICLPKGKMKEDESFLDQTAFREVGEETGRAGKITGFAGSIDYEVNGKMKLVLFWNMKDDGIYNGPKGPEDEVKKVIWVSPKTAIDMLTYPKEKEIVACVFSLKTNKSKKRIRIRKRTLKYKRLESSLKTYRIELGYRISKIKASEDTFWADSAMKLLNQAEKSLLQNNIDEGWKCLHAARRMVIFGMDEIEIKSLKSSIKSEVLKLSEWRKKAAEELLCSDAVKDKESVYQAALIRDEHYNNQYYKINLFSSQIKLISIILIINLLALIAFFIFALPYVKELWAMLCGVLLFGTFGGVFSTALVSGKPSDRSAIPELITNTYVIFIRITIGAASAFIIYFFLQLNIISFLSITQLEESPFWYFIISFAAGFSERIVINAIQAVLGSQEKKKE